MCETLNQKLQEKHEGDEAGRCGGCGSRNLMRAELPVTDVAHAVCLDCQRLHEVEHRDWPLSAMCDNCAFRKGSPERDDPARWAEMMATLAAEQRFHCHKGLPMSLPDKNGDVHFEPPDAAKGRVKICAGWLAMFMKQFEIPVSEGKKTQCHT